MGMSEGGVTIPKWLFGIITSVGTVVLLGLGGWVVKTWDAPEKIATLEVRVQTLEAERADERLKQQAKLATMTQDIALMKKDLSAMASSQAELRPLILEAIR